MKQIHSSSYEEQKHESERGGKMRFQTIYECSIITPLFLVSADPQQVELRAPSFKGGIRFWWRALNGNLGIKDMKKKEAELFGASNETIGRSKLCLCIPAKQLEKIDYPPVPHWEDKPEKKSSRIPRLPAAEPEQRFQVLLTSTGDKTTHEKYQAIFEVALLLGGFGKRSRRGFGSIEIIKRNGNEYNTPGNMKGLLNLLEKINQGQFLISEDEKRIVSKGFTGGYPYVKEIEIGRKYSDMHGLLKTIGHASSDYICDYLGYAKAKDRLASPIYVSIIRNNEGYKPIITTLNTCFNPRYLYHKDQPNNQQDFKGAIL